MNALHCRGDKIVARFVLHESKSMNSHEGTCRYNMSLGHVPATFSCVYGCCDFVPATCPCLISPECVHHKILLLLHVAATCPCKMSPRVQAPLCMIISRGRPFGRPPFCILRQIKEAWGEISSSPCPRPSVFL